MTNPVLSKNPNILDHAHQQAHHETPRIGYIAQVAIQNVRTTQYPPTALQ